MKKEIEAQPDICRKLRFEAVRRIKCLHFLLLEYCFFKENEDNGALLLSLPLFLFPLSLITHIVKSRALVLLKLPCYFVKLETKTVGLFAFQEHHKSLLIASLGVAREYRRLGIGMCILGYFEMIARGMNKRWLEVDVLRKNIPAQLLYTKYGFTFIKSGRMHYMMRGKKPL